MNQIIFNKIDKQDENFITSLYNYYIKNTTTTYHIEELTKNKTIDHFHIYSPDTDAFIIQYNQQACGFCILKPYNISKEGYKFSSEITIYIMPEYYHKGIGEKAVDFLHKIAISKKIHVIIAAICSENTASIKLFESFNYKKCGHLKEVGFKFDRKLDTVYYQTILD